ncbi:MAG TPA: hypothetical protein VFA56_04545 [Gaiellaceae bacterium]|nr:hypothetical protein [Gaiellaceae bacterium]
MHAHGDLVALVESAGGLRPGTLATVVGRYSNDDSYVIKAGSVVLHIAGRLIRSIEPAIRAA